MTGDNNRIERLRFVTLSEMSGREAHDLLKLRFDVFILEQESLYPEIDGRDPDALHAVVADEDGAPVATLRMLGLKGDGPVVIGRVAVRMDQRGDGLGRSLIAAALEHLAGIAPGRAIKLSAQMQLEAFYASFGFRTVSGVYDDGGIPHVKMERP